MTKPKKTGKGWKGRSSRDESQPMGERSKHVQEYKKATGLPSKQELNELHDMGLLEQVERKIEMFKRYNQEQTALYKNMTALGWDSSKMLERVAELDLLLIDRKQRLLEAGEDPLEDDIYTDLQEKLWKRLEFLQKQGLDTFKFEKEYNLKASKQSSSDDDIFTVEN